MAEIGQMNMLKALREAPPGWFLDGGDSGEILLPGKYIPAEKDLGDFLNVFVYRDSEDRLVATTTIPFAMAGDFAALRVAGFDLRRGAFLDWGLEKDLLLPMRELGGRVEVGDLVVVAVYLDHASLRLAASQRIEKHVQKGPIPYRPRQRVQLLVATETPLGFKAIIENAHIGLIYSSDLREPLAVGQKIHGFIRTVRPDGKIDLSLDQEGHERIEPMADRLLGVLTAAGGSLPVGDHTSPEEIRAMFQMSKKAFKQALGTLFRNRRIVLEQSGIRLAPPDQVNEFRPGIAKPPRPRSRKGRSA